MIYWSFAYISWTAQCHICKNVEIFNRLCFHWSLCSFAYDIIYCHSLFLAPVNFTFLVFLSGAGSPG